MQKLSVENQSEPLDENYFDSSETYDFNTENIDSPSTFGLFFRMIVVLIIVVAFIYLLFFFIKKKTSKTAFFVLLSFTWKESKEKSFPSP